MTEEMIKLAKLLAAEVEELKTKLAAVEELLGGPHAKDFSEAVLSTIVDDVIRYNMMIEDIAKFLARELAHEIRGFILTELKERVAQRINK